MKNYKLKFNRYIKYLVVGTVSGIITVVSREVFYFLLQSNGIIAYVFSIAMAYLIGMFTSYILNSLFTFNNELKTSNIRLVVNFFIVSVLGFISTTILSLGFRYVLSFFLVTEYNDSIAFVIGTLTSSLLTFSLNSMFVFTKKDVEESNAS